MLSNVELEVSLNLEDLAIELARRASYEQLIAFIEDVDNTVADWDFTDKIIAYAEEQKKKRLQS